MRALATTIIALGLLSGDAFAQSGGLPTQQRPERDGRIEVGDVSKATAERPRTLTTAPVIQMQIQGLNGKSSDPTGICPSFSGYYVMSASRTYCHFKAASLSTGSCGGLCGYRTYYQHYTVSMPGSSVGGYEEQVTYACYECPPPPPIYTGGENVCYSSGADGAMICTGNNLGGN